VDQPAPPVAPPRDDVQHYPFIDALRGWAFLSVVLVHVHGSLLAPEWLGLFQRAGNYGVQLFFVVSALTLFMSYESRRTRDRRPEAAFFIRRFFRIAPMFWLAMIGYLALDGIASRGFTLPQIAATAAFLHGWHPSTINAIVPGGWSIAVEMNFYLMLPFCFHHLQSLGRSVAAWAAVLAASLGICALTKKVLVRSFGGETELLHNFLYYWLPRQLPVFFLGFVLYFLMKRVRASARPPSGTGLLVVSLGTIGALLAVGHRLPLTYLLFSVAFVLLALALSIRPTLILVNPLTRYAGKVSYSAYLTHFVVVRGVEGLVPRWGLGSALDAHPVAGFVLLYLASVAVTIVASTLTYHAVEMPGQNLGKKLIRKINQPPVAA
jgi:peptidoglycan/LPS O-acetylase OafA/YrhL